MDLFIYLAKASLILTLFWVIYKLFLEVETYHRFKRIYLLAGYVISLILPLFTYTQIEEITLASSGFLPSSSEFDPVAISKSPLESFWGFVTEHSILELTYLAISLVFVIHLGLKFFKLLRFLKRSRVLKTNGSLLIEKAIPEGAYSFLNYIVYNPDLYSVDELNIILAHEQAHIHKRHSLDILLAHVYKCFFWFNPFAWLYQKSLVLNLEYEADAKVVDTTTKRNYQLTLYSITQQQYKHQLQHSFNQSPIKKRIAMLNKNKHNSSLWKLFIVSPLLVVFFLLFQVETKAQIKTSATTSDDDITKVEISYDENTTREELNSDREFLKEEFNIDMSYSKLRFSSEGKLEAITLDVDCNDGFKGSVTSPDVEKLPVYFYRNYAEDGNSPFGIGTKRGDEQLALPESESLKDIETFIVNEQKIKKDDLLDKYIPVKRYNHMEDSNTLYITTRSEFSKPYYDRMFEAKDELNALFEQGEPEGVVYFKVEEDNVVVMTINNFKVSNNKMSPSTVSKSKFEADFETDFNAIKEAENFIINGKTISKETLARTYIPVNTYSYNKKTKTLSIDTRSEFSKPYYSKLSAITDELINKFGKNINDEITYIRISSDHVPVLISLTDFKISGSTENASQMIDPNQSLIDKKTSLSGEAQNSKEYLKVNGLNFTNDFIFIIDGVKAEPGEIVNLDLNQIGSVDIIKAADKLKAKGYDANFVNGLIYITTKKTGVGEVSDLESDRKLKRLSLESKGQNVIYILDGKEVDYNQLKSLKPEEINSMDVVKSPYNLKKAGYDPKEIDGVIYITTKN